MVDSLQLHQIDAVLLWSEVAETFSFTLHEALAAGAFIITNPNSGNINFYIENNPFRGVVYKNANLLIDNFTNGDIITLVNKYNKDGKHQALLTFGGFEECNE